MTNSRRVLFPHCCGASSQRHRSNGRLGKLADLLNLCIVPLKFTNSRYRSLVCEFVFRQEQLTTEPPSVVLVSTVHKNKTEPNGSVSFWWPRRDLNPQGLRHTILSRACIPFHHLALFVTRHSREGGNPDIKLKFLDINLSTEDYLSQYA